MTAPSPKSAWSRRQNIAFCFGLTFLPVFWVWWTSHSRFTSTQRIAAIIWTTIYLSIVATTYPQMADRYHLLWDVRFWLFGMITSGLAVLLFLRTMMGIQLLLILYGANVISFLLPATDRIPTHLEFAPVLTFAVVCVFHLSLDRLREVYRKLEKIHIRIPLPW